MTEGYKFGLGYFAKSECQPTALRKLEQIKDIVTVLAGSPLEKSLREDGYFRITYDTAQRWFDKIHPGSKVVIGDFDGDGDFDEDDYEIIKKLKEIKE